MILNPEKLNKTEEELNAFAFELKEYIRDMIGLPHRERVQYGKGGGYSAEEKTVKNSR